MRVGLSFSRVCLLATVALASVRVENASAQQTYQLASSRKADDLTRVQVLMRVEGNAKLAANSRLGTLPMKVAASLNYDERVLALNSLDSGTSRSVRHYDRALAILNVDKGEQKPLLRPERRLIQVEATRGATTLFSPLGPISRDELDLIDVPGNSLVLDELLPKAAVVLGAKWQLADHVLAPLLGVDAISRSKVECILAAVEDGVAKIEGSGTVSAAVAGVSTEMDLKAKYHFDLDQGRITWFALMITEKRSIGHVGPGLDVVAKVVMEIEPLEESENLSTKAVAELPKKVSPELTRLEYESQQGHFRVSYDRRWYLTSDEHNLAVLRLLDRGELVAQCNVSPLLGVSPRKAVGLAEFQDDVKRSLGKDFREFLKASQFTPRDGQQVLRVVAAGEASQLPIEWIYYLVTSTEGQRVSIAFTVETSLLERFGEADRQFLAGLKFGEPAVKTAETPAAKR